MTTQQSFADATAVAEVGGGSDRAKRYTAEVFPGWDIGGAANGGYLMAIAGRAMADAVGRPPLSITGHYLRPGLSGSCTVDVDAVRVGRRLATARATLRVDGEETLELLGTFGDQQRDPDGFRWADAGPVDVPAYDDCLPMKPPNESDGPALMGRLACRLHPADAGFRTGEPTGTPRFRGWFALADDEPVDAIGLLLAADAFPPPVFNADLPIAWVPTVELTVHVRGVPAPGPLRCVFRTRFIHDGLLDEEGEIWDSTDTLVAQCRQLALMPR